MHNGRMRPGLRRSVWQWMVVLLIVLLAAGQPLNMVRAAPALLSPHSPAAAPALATYEDPDGLFSLEVPNAFSVQNVLSYESISDTPPAGLLASTGNVFADTRNANNIVVLFLLLDGTIDDVDTLEEFVAEFQTAAGGELLPNVTFEFDGDGQLYASGTAENAERYLWMSIEAQSDVVAVLAAGLQQRALPRYLDDVGVASDSFTWSAENVRRLLSGEQGPEPAPEAEITPESEETPEPEATPEPIPGDPYDPTQMPIMPEMERYTDPDGAFTLLVPVGLEARPAEPTNAGYGMAFYDPDEEESILQFPDVGVSIVSAAKLFDIESENLPLRPISDDEWIDLIELILQGFEDFDVLQDWRDELARTAYIELYSGPLFEDNSSLRTWLWIEEAEGVLIFLLATGNVLPMQPDMNKAVFHASLASFGWDPEAAKEGIIANVGMAPTLTPPAFDDPLSLVEISIPALYPFQAAYFEEGTLHYRFATTPEQGVVTLSLGDPKDEAYTDEEWEEVAVDVEASALDTITDLDPEGNPRILSADIGLPEVDSGHSVLVRAQSDTLELVLAVHEREGVLATWVWIVPAELWTLHENEINASLVEAAFFEPADVRDALDAYNDAGITLLGSETVAGRPVPGQEIVPHYLFTRDEIATVVVFLEESQLSGRLSMILTEASMQEAPVAVYDVDVSGETVGDAAIARDDFIVRQDENGTRVGFVYDPHFSLTPGEYTAVISYNGTPIAVHRFPVLDDEDVEPELVDFGIFVSSLASHQEMQPTTVVHANDYFYARGTGNLPPGTLRLFWYDNAGELITGQIQTRRLSSQRAIEEWFVFYPEFFLEPGEIRYLLALDGIELASGTLTVIEDAPPVELDDDGDDFFAALPLPQDIELAEVVEGVDLAVVLSEEFPEQKLYDTIGAWLRQQGWQQTLPLLESPLELAHQRWVKDGYQFVLTPGIEEAAGEVWMRYMPVDDPDYVPPPVGDTPITPENILESRTVGVAGIAGETATEAVMSPDGQWLAIVTAEGRLALFDAHTLLLKQWWRLEDGEYRSPIFDNSGQNLAVVIDGENRSQVQIFAFADEIWMPIIILVGHEDLVTALYGAGNLTSVSLDGTLRVWLGVSTTVIPMDGPVVDLVSPDDQIFLIGLEGGEVQVWEDDSLLYGFATNTETPQLAVSPIFDENGVGDVLVTGDGVTEWWLYGEEGAELLSPIPVTDDPFISNAGAVSPDGGLMSAAGPYVTFYERASGDYLADWAPHADGEPVEVLSATYSPDGNYLITVTADGRVQLLAVAP